MAFQFGFVKTGRNAPNFKANLYSYTSYRPAYESAVNQKFDKNNCA
nr:MAG TPA: hypothetical protein [Caudoviricetes sp.]